jgi:transposase InsO family protein
MVEILMPGPVPVEIPAHSQANPPRVLALTHEAHRSRAVLRLEGCRRIAEGFRPPRGARPIFAASFCVSERTVGRWIRRADRQEEPKKRGPKPRSKKHMDDAIERTREILDRLGWEHGEGSVDAELKRLGIVQSIDQTRKALVVLRAERKKAVAEAQKGYRLTIVAKAKAALWALDATELARDPEVGDFISTEVLIDAGTKSMAKPKAYWGSSTTAHALEILITMADQEGGFPLVLMHDNGAAYTSEGFQEFLREKGIISLPNLPRTPKHNSFAERTVRELKGNAAMIDPALLDNTMSDIDYIQSQIGHAHRIHQTRPRNTPFGALSALELDKQLTKAYDLVDRRTFYDAAKMAMAAARLAHKTVRAQRLAERYAVLRTLCLFGLIEVSRGGVRLAPEEVDINS